MGVTRLAKLGVCLLAPGWPNRNPVEQFLGQNPETYLSLSSAVGNVLEWAATPSIVKADRGPQSHLSAEAGGSRLSLGE